MRRHASRPEDTSRLTAAVTLVAEAARTHGAKAVAEGIPQIRAAMLTPVDPSSLRWTVHELLEVEDSEPSWTKWLAGILKPESGVRLSALVWRSLVDAVVAQGRDPQPRECEHGVLADLAFWRGEANRALPFGSVDREVPDPDLGRPDILIDAPGLYVVLENKLEEGWHDGPEPQAVRYRRFGLKYRAAGKRLGLVVLTNRDDFGLDPEFADYVRIDYRALGQALRRSLRAEFDHLGKCLEHSLEVVLEAWPAIITVGAIERNLLGFDIRGLVYGSETASWHALEKVSQILQYLRETVR